MCHPVLIMSYIISGERIYALLENTLTDWKLLPKTGLCLRDNAANMVAAFNVEGSVLDSAGCLNHTLQLVIKDGLFSLPSVENLILKCRNLASHANMSTNFYAEFYRCQSEFQNITDHRSLRNDVATRW